MSTKTKSAQSDNGQLSTLEAREVLAQEQQQRVDACRAELEQLLDRHRCRLDVAVVLRANSVTPQLQIVPEA